MWMAVFADMGASLLVGLARIFGQAQFVWLTPRSA
ncbi:Uncharacterised protein [Ralstonia pickettii]|jgi:hypothetical protein|uniref:Uncharacterized protein n=1 Tax=Ralstonia flatus TaxID=3058601 RepID=A0AAD2C424_9RALS|nr:hypothetical protein HMPREF0989_04242 [Ralstonia sp. 5_2_56FAA]QQK35295.1 hypothetical protein RP6297_01497 [Ralstonia pickettii]CAJ0896937.1 hypothetical protein R77567_04774 [Ralstonia sp. LMG 32965]CAJ0903228.1 hypothetical protein R77564_04868 [Ralstonia sp. LMG 32965]SUD99575.1 Uncharacterised protein [Ralstonia pickettii]